MIFAFIACWTMAVLNQLGLQDLFSAPNPAHESGAAHPAKITPSPVLLLSASPYTSVPLYTPVPTSLTIEPTRSINPMATVTRTSSFEQSGLAAFPTPSSFAAPSKTMSPPTSTPTSATTQYSEPDYCSQRTVSRPILAYRMIGLTISDAYDWILLHRNTIVCTAVLYLLSLVVYLHIHACVSVCVSAYVSYVSAYVSACVSASLPPLRTVHFSHYIEDVRLYKPEECPFEVQFPDFEGAEAEAVPRTLTSLGLYPRKGDVKGGARMSMRRATRVGQIDVSSEERTGEVRIPGSQDRVDGFLDEDFGSQTMARGSSGTSPQSRDASRRWQREQPGDSHMAHRSQQSALESYDIVHSSQGTTSNTQFSRDRKSIRPISGCDAATLRSPPAHSLQVGTRPSPSSLPIYCPFSPEIMAELEAKLKAKRKPDRRASDSLFSLHLSEWVTGKAWPTIKRLFPLSSSLRRAFKRGETLDEGSSWQANLCEVDSKPMVVKKVSQNSVNPFFPACELAVMMALDHPNIVRNHSASRWLKDIYLAMEFMNGGNLKNLRSRNRNLPEKAIAAIMREILEGLAYMHEKNYVHCDLKPENIFLSTDGEVKIGGMGLAKDARVGDILRERATGQYIPPEGRLQEPSKAGDIWALAMCAIESFAGELPPGKDGCEMVMKSRSEDHPPLPCNVSRDFAEFLSMASQFDQEDRATARELLRSRFIRNNPSAKYLRELIKI